MAQSSGIRPREAKDYKPLSPRTERFCEEYIIDLDMKNAAIRAGYSPKSAGAQAWRLLQDPRVQGEVQWLMNKRSARMEVTADTVINEIAKSGFSNIQHLFDEEGRLKNIQDLPPSVAASIASIEVVTKEITEKGDVVDVEYIHKIKMWDKTGSLRDLGKHLELFTDKVKDVSEVVPMRVEIVFKGKK